MGRLLGALDQGTTSTRFMVFDDEGVEVGRHQLEHAQLQRRPGWVEHDPSEIWRCTQSVIARALADAGIAGADLAAIGITNQRETAVVWDRASGRPLADALVWQDTRTADEVRALQESAGGELVRSRTGLLPATYFSATKLRWLLDNVPGARQAAEAGSAAMGTIDSWLVWQLTGGASHVTDVTNASRTMLMDLASLDWDDDLLELFDVPRRALPDIGPSCRFGGSLCTTKDGPFGAQVPITAVLGDQQAALFGQACFGPGDAKCTYGTGSFALLNTGDKRVTSKSGLLSTVAYQIEGRPPVYALEGSVAVTGSLVQWMRDQLGVIASAADVEALAASVSDSAGLVIVPAFAGLFAPHWRPDARGSIFGLTRAHTRGHLARAALEAICLQCREIIELLVGEAGARLGELRVDGGVSANDLCMQLQADVLGVPVVRPQVTETTALGAALAAGLGAGVFETLDETAGLWRAGRRFEPQWSTERRDEAFARFERAVRATLEFAGSPTGAASGADRR